MASSDEPDWVELRRFVDSIEAEITSDFLRDHGIDVVMRGNSANIVALNHLNSIIDMRLNVPRIQLDEAREVLAAMRPPEDAVIDAPPLSGEAFATKGSYRRNEDDEDEERDAHRPKFRRAAFLLAFIFPLGGGHFYARHTGVGAVMAATNLCCFFLLFSRPSMVIAPMLLVAGDALLGMAAVRRYNEQRIPSEPMQALVAAIGATIAVTIAWSIGP